MSYARLAKRAKCMGNAFRCLGIEAGDRVLFIASDSPDLVAAFLGCIMLGGVGILVSTRMTGEDLTGVINDGLPKLIVLDESLRELCESAIERATHNGALVPLRDEAGPEGRSSSLAAMADGCTAMLEPVSRETSHPAFWICSSGTTGRPKCVIHTHRDLRGTTDFHRETLSLRPGDIVFCTSKLSFAYALGNALLAPLQLGATMVLHPGWPTLENVIGLVAHHRPKVMFTVPSLYRTLLHELRETEWSTLRAVQSFVSAGETLPTGIAARWLAATGQPILNCYGCSETIFLAFTNAADDALDGAVGRPAPSVDVRLVGRQESEVRRGEVGSLWLRHPFLAAGYANRPDLTVRRFRDGWFLTGDLFRSAETGRWHHQGREDDLTKVAGQWVHLQEIEDLATPSPLVSEVAAVAAKDPDGMKRIALFIVPVNSVDGQAASNWVRSALAENLPRYKRPRWVHIVDSLPRTVTGKIQKHRLRGIVEGKPA